MSTDPYRVWLKPNSVFTDLTLETSPPEIVKQNKRVLIIGGSVTGLTNAWLLLDMGYDVTVIADAFASDDPSKPIQVTGQIAGALWEYPPAVCGQHTDETSIAMSKKWCQVSRRVFTDIYQKLSDSGKVHGVSIPIANFFFTKSLDDPSMVGQKKKMEEIAALHLKGFRHDKNLIQEHSVLPESGVVDAYCHRAPVIDTDAYLVWLLKLVKQKGATCTTIPKITKSLVDEERNLLHSYKADAILNATGLGSFELAEDTGVYPVRGTLIRVKNNNEKFPKITEVLAVSNTDVHKMDDIVFIVPRNETVLLLGGSVEPDEWKLNLTMDSTIVKNMRKRCNTFIPGLENAEYDDNKRLLQGLRPFRKGNLRVEREGKGSGGQPSRIVHSYGHGGSGFTLSFGTALDTYKLIYLVCEQAIGSDGRPHFVLTI